METAGAADDRGWGRTLPHQSVWSHKSVVSRRFSPERCRHTRTEPQSWKLLCRDRAGRLQSGQYSRRHWILPRQNAAGTTVFIRRRTAIPTRSEQQSDTGQPSEMPRSFLPSRRTDAHRRQLRRHCSLRAQQLRRMARHTCAQGTAPDAAWRCLRLRRARTWRRLLHPARQTVAPDERGRQASHLPEYRGTDEGGAALHPPEARARLPQCRSGIRRHARAGVRHQPWWSACGRGSRQTVVGQTQCMPPAETGRVIATECTLHSYSNSTSYIYHPASAGGFKPGDAG